MNDSEHSSTKADGQANDLQTRKTCGQATHAICVRSTIPSNIRREISLIRSESGNMTIVAESQYPGEAEPIVTKLGLSAIAWELLQDAISTFSADPEEWRVVADRPSELGTDKLASR